MDTPCFYPSLTRISPLADGGWTVGEVPRDHWATGDYVLCRAEPRGFDQLELATGRMVTVSRGDHFIGALGDRQATIEATGSWRDIGNDQVADVLTSAGLIGKMTSKSPFLPEPMHAHYEGHVFLGKEKATMSRFVEPVEKRNFSIPVVMMVGTSMSSGKTAAGGVVVRRLKRAGLRVLGAKITGAGRYRDVKSLADAGAEWIYDFVDAGLPSTVCPDADYQDALSDLLSMMARHEADVAVVEIGASPLEPYQGVTAIETIRSMVRCTVLAASDAYSVVGLRQSFDIEPDFVCGPAVSTDAGSALVKQLSAITPLNVVNEDAIPELDRILNVALGLGEGRS